MKINSELILIVTGIVLMLVSNSVMSTYAAASNSGQINWGEICRMADPLIAEPCNTLTSPDGYTLTEEGNRVFIVCVGLGTATSLIEGLQFLTPLITNIANCGGTNAQSNDISKVSNLLANFLGPNSASTSANFNVNQKSSQPDLVVPSYNHDISSPAISIVPGASAPASGLGYEPASITVSAGTPLTWRNDDTTLHTITSGNAQAGDSGRVFDSSYLAAGKTFEFTFNNIGTYGYYCTLHPYMTGRVIVQ